MRCDNYCGRNHLLRKTVATSNRIQRKTDMVGVVVQESLLYLCHLQLYLAGRLQVSSNPAPSQGAQSLHPPYLQGNVIDLHVVGAPLPKELDVGGLCYCRCSCFPLRHPRDKNRQSPGICITNSEASLEHNQNWEITSNQRTLGISGSTVLNLRKTTLSASNTCLSPRNPEAQGLQAPPQQLQAGPGMGKCPESKCPDAASARIQTPTMFFQSSTNLQIYNSSLDSAPSSV